MLGRNWKKLKQCHLLYKAMPKSLKGQHATEIGLKIWVWFVCKQGDLPDNDALGSVRNMDQSTQPGPEGFHTLVHERHFP